MGELDAAVADTHALIYYSTKSSRLGARARRLFEAAEQGDTLIYIPLAVVWELALADRVGRVRLRQSVPQLFSDLFSNPAFAPYDLTLDQIYTAAALGFNRDPFDALIVSAAVLLELPLMTRDAEIVESRTVRVIW